jgi:flagellar hook protein FlgE
MGGSVEFSTVDIAREFTNLIVLQRGYQANAKVVTAVDEISQETINLKR